MCGNLFGSKAPKVQKVDPVPQAIAPQETEAISDAADKQRRRRGYAATRIAEDRSVLTDSAQTGGRTTLG